MSDTEQFLESDTNSVGMLFDATLYETGIATTPLYEGSSVSILQALGRGFQLVCITSRNQ